MKVKIGLINCGRIRFDQFRTLDIQVGDPGVLFRGSVVDLKVKSVDGEAYGHGTRKKYLRWGRLTNLGDAQSKETEIRVNGKDRKYFVHTSIYAPRWLHLRVC